MTCVNMNQKIISFICKCDVQTLGEVFYRYHLPKMIFVDLVM